MLQSHVQFECFFLICFILMLHCQTWLWCFILKLDLDTSLSSSILMLLSHIYILTWMLQSHLWLYCFSLSFDFDANSYCLSLAFDVYYLFMTWLLQCHLWLWCSSLQLDFGVSVSSLTLMLISLIWFWCFSVMFTFDVHLFNLILVFQCHLQVWCFDLRFNFSLELLFLMTWFFSWLHTLPSCDTFTFCHDYWLALMLFYSLSHLCLCIDASMHGVVLFSLLRCFHLQCYIFLLLIFNFFHIDSCHRLVIQLSTWGCGSHIWCLCSTFASTNDFALDYKDVGPTLKPCYLKE